MQLFVTIFDVVWLLAVLGLLIYLAITSNRRTSRMTNALLSSLERSYDVAQKSTETANRLAQLIEHSDLSLFRATVVPPKDGQET